MDGESRSKPGNADLEVIKAFGEEWSRFNQAELSEPDRRAIFDDYFHLFPWERLSLQAVGADIGCGSGRWSMLAAPRVGVLHCVDPSGAALAVARSNLGSFGNVRFHQAGVEALPFPDESLDFAYSLGVLHHVPDTVEAIRSVAAKLKSGAPFLIYLYYAFDNRPYWFRLLWRVSDVLRRVVSRLPFPLRYVASQVMAACVYWPLARTALLLDRLGCLPATWPLAYYRDKSFYVMRTDALDRFGTKLEQRFTRRQIREMLETSGFTDVRFSEAPPMWCAVCIRR